ncbi:UDP-N-acetylmuramyl pentapeptide phosphotransferase/UDP-N-acetylglucosamine-1-phosphate transferase [Chitinophaga niastensis]|uniref:UDP-N-acetylmuramyl pentapeptide phosphotransferase/UDP-N-acetylglucosamine-1-phosphate transferase n=1 Tax=Chitinophaga niastensis TaxID=536980 RepID=A0A2P8HFB2_CHINA|nr:glycosyltransferase family 4 protein [Chitinophaga niastensis]PSL44906.1 UDP-N-acetylmuramyl pentapeptide phosphotransferase/UDP-N-acetylglucosamine-1-phosphate transferase [Chitinophaga niastensis]
MIYLVLIVLFFLLMFGYFRVADKYNIVDKPNERSSHSSITIRGGGIIFIVAALVALVWHFNEYWLPVAGIIMVGIISFLDDIFTLSNRIRIVFHMMAVTCMFVYLSVFSNFPVYGVICLYILAIGIINAYNFMDGINGITGIYSLVVLLSLQMINIQVMPFIQPDMVWLPILACIVFLFFNFRTKAICFAGDVGSVTIAFWIITLLLDLILTSGNWIYILFLAVYGVDAILTIVHRLLLKQNIFKAHRSHFYQILANDRKVSHLVISTAYGVMQMAINLLVIYSNWNATLTFVVICAPLTVIYISLKNKLMIKTVAL